MEENLKISIIIPTYNNELYLEKCILSIINQTYKNLEIIIVDDGSTDRTREICRKLKNMDDRITYYYKNNSGVSSSRNYGLDLATGDFIAFVDADDYIEKNMYERMINELLSTDADMIWCDIILEFENEPKKPEHDIKEKTTFTRKDSILYILNGGLSVCYNKLIKKCIAKERFVDLSVSEDVLYTINICLKSKKTVMIYDQLYHYVRHDSSKLVDSFNENHLDSLKSCEKISEIVLSEYPELLPNVQSFQYIYFIGSLARIYVWDVEKKYSLKVREICKKISFIFKTMEKKNISSIKILSWYLYLFNKYIFKVIMKKYYFLTLYKLKNKKIRGK